MSRPIQVRNRSGPTPGEPRLRQRDSCRWPGTGQSLDPSECTVSERATASPTPTAASHAGVDSSPSLPTRKALATNRKWLQHRFDYLSRSDLASRNSELAKTVQDAEIDAAHKAAALADGIELEVESPASFVQRLGEAIAQIDPETFDPDKVRSAGTHAVNASPNAHNSTDCSTPD
jgi:hypothetical protein